MTEPRALVVSVVQPRADDSCIPVMLLGCVCKGRVYVHPVNRKLGASERKPPRLHPATPTFFPKRQR